MLIVEIVWHWFLGLFGFVRVASMFLSYKNSILLW